MIFLGLKLLGYYLGDLTLKYCILSFGWFMSMGVRLREGDYFEVVKLAVDGFFG